MKEKVYTLLGLIGPLIAYTSIGISISRSPWFSWESSALSDLGHSVKSSVAPIFNLGLLFTGFLLLLYVFTIFRKYVKYSASGLVVCSLFLQLIATFDEVYGLLHWVVSVLFFLSMCLTSLIYAYEKRSLFAFIMFVIGSGSWIVYGLGSFRVGVAVPEIISSITVMLWLVSFTGKLYFRKNMGEEANGS